ncbi:MAG: hypothetical protein ACOYMA_04685 [Bacteroidia bacterium]
MKDENNKIEEMDLLPIPLPQAIDFIKRFKSDTVHAIPTAWLFEDYIIPLLSIPGFEGIRFYTAIDIEKYSANNGIITFIMVPVIKDNNNVLIELENKAYEFSKMCPRICNNGIPGPIISDASIMIPRSYFFSKSFLVSNFSMHNQSKGFRLYSEIINSRLELRMVPVVDIAPNYDDLPAPNYTGNYLVCDANNLQNCDLTSILYKAQ